MSQGPIPQISPGIVSVHGPVVHGEEGSLYPLTGSKVDDFRRWEPSDSGDELKPLGISHVTNNISGKKIGPSTCPSRIRWRSPGENPLRDGLHLVFLPLRRHPHAAHCGTDSSEFLDIPLAGEVV